MLLLPGQKPQPLLSRFVWFLVKVAAERETIQIGMQCIRICDGVPARCNTRNQPFRQCEDAGFP
jgi:hypothetical protein